MFSEQLQKIERTSSRNLFLIAAVLVIFCQLVAMAMVADGQVKKAALREAQLSAQNVASASCFETSAKFDVNNCVRQLQAENSPNIINTVTGYNPGFNGSQSNGFTGGLTNVTFAAH